MRMRVGSVFFLMLLAPPLRAGISSGGDFSLALSAPVSGDGQASGGGDFNLQPALGQVLPPPAANGLLEAGGFQVRRGFLSPPRFRYQNALALAAADASGAVSLSFAADVLPEPTFDISFRADPLNNPFRVDPDKIREANVKMAANRGPLAQVPPTHVWEINVFDEVGFYDGALSPEGSIAFSYRDDNADGIVDGTNPPVRVKTMSLWTLDEAMSMWVKVPKSSIDTSTKKITSPLAHLSVYAFIGGADTAVSEVYAFPVPFRPFGPDAGTGPGQTGSAASGITFTNLPSEGKIEIYTPTLRLVRRIEIPPNLAPPRLSWDVRNESGQTVASGVYIWRISSGPNAKTGRLVVIR